MGWHQRALPATTLLAATLGGLHGQLQAAAAVAAAEPHRRPPQPAAESRRVRPAPPSGAVDRALQAAGAVPGAAGICAAGN